MAAGRILIVDDDSRNIFALSATLRSRTYECVSCMDAISAIKMLEAGERFDAVLMDMMMPEMDGYEAIKQIRSIPGYEDTLIIAVTAQAMRGDRERCLEAGADQYISKPVDVDKLIDALKN